MRAADSLVESLQAEGVKHVFGIPGGANLPTYDALVDARKRVAAGEAVSGEFQSIAATLN